MSPIELSWTAKNEAKKENKNEEHKIREKYKKKWQMGKCLLVPEWLPVADPINANRGVESHGLKERRQPIKISILSQR